MKTWQGLKHLEENSPVKQEDSYRFKAEANANKVYEGLIKKAFQLVDLYDIIEELSRAVRDPKKIAEIILSATSKINKARIVIKEMNILIEKNYK